ncbi:MAG: ion transporter [bacterium]
MQEKLSALKKEIFENILNRKESKLLKYLDYIIIGLIFLSALEVFFSSFKNLSNTQYNILHAINIIIMVIFTIEVSLRIIFANRLNSKYDGFFGRIKYCFSFYGFIDIIATYSYYLTFIFVIPIGIINTLKLLRVLRIFRFFKSTNLFVAAIKSKKNELVISFQLLAIITFILGMLLYFVESSSQKSIYTNPFVSIFWSFAQYIGDPGGYGDFKPITVLGKIIASMVGLLGIAIFAIPAGIIGSGFIEKIEERKIEDDLEETRRQIRKRFRKGPSASLKIQVEPKFQTITWLEVKLCQSKEQLMDAIRNAPDLRIQFSKTSINSRLFDLNIVEKFICNRHYGTYIARDSNVTIINPTGLGEQMISHFTRTLAEYINANYISNEKFQPKHPDDCYDISFSTNAFYEKDTISDHQGLSLFCGDIIKSCDDENHWAIIIETSSSKRTNQIHFCFGGKEGNSNFEQVETPSINEVYYGSFKEFLSESKSVIETEIKFVIESAERTIPMIVGTHESFGGTSKNTNASWVRRNTRSNVIRIFVSIALVAYSSEFVYRNTIKILGDQIKKLSQD